MCVQYYPRMNAPWYVLVNGDRKSDGANRDTERQRNDKRWEGDGCVERVKGRRRHMYLIQMKGRRRARVVLLSGHRSSACSHTTHRRIAGIHRSNMR